jgi:hypothetical protein
MLHGWPYPSLHASHCLPGLTRRALHAGADPAQLPRPTRSRAMPCPAHGAPQEPLYGWHLVWRFANQSFRAEAVDGGVLVTAGARAPRGECTRRPCPMLSGLQHATRLRDRLRAREGGHGACAMLLDAERPAA